MTGVGLAAELSYAHEPSNPFQRAVQVLASTRGGAWLLSRTLARLDRFASERTHGRLSASDVLAGLPSLVLTTTGRKSGQARESRLIAVPIDDTLALLGTNFGQKHTPAWVYNLEADPHAEVSYRDVTRSVVARPATESERARVLAASTHVYGGYVKYQERITGRRLRIFVLETDLSDR